MQRPSIKIRALALFVTVFICLNGAGAACVAYCRSMEKPQSSADHCPLKKLTGHCGSEGKQDNSPAFSANGSDIDCCPMTVSFFAGPIEKNSFSVKQTAAATVITPPTFVFTFRSVTPLRSAISYRGPPPIDRRPDRIKHRVLLV